MGKYSTIAALFLTGCILLSACSGMNIRPTPTYESSRKTVTPRKDIRRKTEHSRVVPRRDSHEEIIWESQCDPKSFSDPYKACNHRKDMALPYPVTHILRGFGKCIRRKRDHTAIDIGGIGKDSGLGTPVRAISRSRVTFVGRRADDRKKFGRTDRRKGSVIRGRKELPRSKRIKGYGRVYFFTRNHGSSKTGEFLVTEGLDGKLKGHKIRYMHMGTIRKEIRKGTILEVGEEFGLMGGTAVMQSPPHLHLDITSPGGRRLDVVPLLGQESKHGPCP